MFTRKQLEKLSEILWSHQDEGPVGYGWPSKEQLELRGIVDEALRNREGCLRLPKGSAPRITVWRDW
jgi:hypothetical protein